MKTKALFFYMFVVSFALYGQTKLKLGIVFNGFVETKVPEYLNAHNTLSDLYREVDRVVTLLQKQGYIACSTDSIVKEHEFYKAFISTNKKFKWVKLGKGNAEDALLSEVNFRERLYTNKTFYYTDVIKLREKILTFYENNGYPFAMFKLDSLQPDSNTVSAALNIERNRQVKIDSIRITGTAKISPTFIYNYLGVKPGSVYNESAISKISQRLRSLPFLSEAKPYNILFTDKFTRLNLELAKKQASQFDGIVGFLPDNTTGSILFTGDVHLKLHNALAHAELIDLNWRSLQKQTQDLKVKFNYPYLFSTPFGADLDFKLYKKDTSFIDVISNFGLQYLFTGTNYFKVTYMNKTSTLLSTKGLEFSTVLPPYADVSSNTYGLGCRFEQLDYKFNPRKGFVITTNAGVGSKTITVNPRLDPLAYKNVQLNTTQYVGDLTLEIYIPLFINGTIKFGNQSAFIQTPQLFRNELFRIGGFKTLRGFDEESIYASAYSILTIEYRLLLEQNSYLFVFGDAAYYERSIIDQSLVHDTPYGFGAGISFETKAGIFSITYALGKQFNNPVNFGAGKIHFGVVSYF